MAALPQGEAASCRRWPAFAVCPRPACRRWPAARNRRNVE